MYVFSFMSSPCQSRTFTMNVVCIKLLSNYLKTICIHLSKCWGSLLRFCVRIYGSSITSCALFRGLSWQLIELHTQQLNTILRNSIFYKPTTCIIGLHTSWSWRTTHIYNASTSRWICYCNECKVIVNP